MHRRLFLRGAGISLGAGVIGCHGAPSAAAPASQATLSASTSDLSTWEAVRRQFPLTHDMIHLAGFFLASHPTPVREAIETHRKGIDENPFTYVEDNVGPCERAARGAIADYLAVRADDLAMTDSTTMGLGLVYGGLKLRPDQEVLTSEHDHPSTVWSLRYRAERTGAAVRTIRLYDPKEGRGVTEDGLVDAVARANAGRQEDDRALLWIDGVHGFGVENVTARDLGCDLFVAGCHKWLFGPRGTGFVWGTPAAWGAITPTIPTFEIMWRDGPRDRLPIAAQATPGGFHSFEHRWALPAAFAFTCARLAPSLLTNPEEIEFTLREVRAMP